MRFCSVRVLAVEGSITLNSAAAELEYFMLYEKMMIAWKACDLEGWKSCYHPDYTFVSHANGNIMSSDDISDEMMLGMMQNMKLEEQRCIYEDENIIVEHSLATFGSGVKEAVMAVHMKKDGLIWQTETGATPLGKT